MTRARGTGAVRRRGGHDERVRDRRDRTWTAVPRRALSRWMIPLYSLLALALVPWVLWLAWTLPASSVTSHYRLAWVGFDVLLAGSMARTAYLAWRRSPFVVNVASATATLLVVDAWFDVTTSPGGDDLVGSALLAVFVELPLAALSLVLAGRAQIEIARTGAVAPRRRVLQWVAAQSLGDSLADAVGKGRANAAMTSAAPSTSHHRRWSRQAPRSRRRRRPRRGCRPGMGRHTCRVRPRPRRRPDPGHRVSPVRPALRATTEKRAAHFRSNSRPRCGGEPIEALSSVPTTESPERNRPQGHGPQDFPGARAPLEPRPAAAAPDARRRPCSREPARSSRHVRVQARARPRSSRRPAAVRLPARA